MSERPGRYQRSFSGMIGAMVVLLLAIGAFAVFRDSNRVAPGEPVEEVDYAAPAAFAAGEVDYDLLAPTELPKGWFATSVRYVAVDRSWHVGILTEDRGYVGIEQADESVAAMVSRFVDEEAEQGDDVTVDGTTWESWSDAGGDHALVREDGDYTSLVVGTVGEEELAGFVATLATPDR